MSDGVPFVIERPAGAPAIAFRHVDLNDLEQKLKAGGMTFPIAGDVLAFDANGDGVVDRGYVLDQGHNAYTGTGRDLATDPKVVQLYLGTLAKA